MSAQKRQKMSLEPLIVKTITTKDYHRPPNSMMLAWGVQRSKMKPQLDWSKSTTKTSYRMLAVLMKCHRAKFPPVDVPVVYREDLPREGKPLRLGTEDLGMFIVTDLVPRLKEKGMLQLTNKVLIMPIEGSPNTFRLEIIHSMCPYCEQAIHGESEIVECEGCDALAHRQCVSTIWADDERATPTGATGHPSFKFACPTCEAREPVVSYSETCTLQTTTQNGHASSLRAGLNPLKRPLPGMDAPPTQPFNPPHTTPNHPSAQHTPTTNEATAAAGPSSQAAGAKTTAPPTAAANMSQHTPHDKTTNSAPNNSNNNKQQRPSSNTTLPSDHPPSSPANAQTQHTTAAQAQGSTGSGSLHVNALRALGNNHSSMAAGANETGARGQKGGRGATAGGRGSGRKGEGGESSAPSSSGREEQHRKSTTAAAAAAPAQGGAKQQTTAAAAAAHGAKQTQQTGGRGGRGGGAQQQQQQQAKQAQDKQQQQQAKQQGKLRGQAVPPGPPPQPVSPATITPRHTPAAPVGGKGTGMPSRSPLALNTPDSAGLKTPGSGVRDSQRSANIIARMSKLKQDVDEHIEEIEGLRGEMEDMQAELDAYRAEEGVAQAAQADLQNENAALKAESAQSKEQVAALQSSVRGLQSTAANSVPRAELTAAQADAAAARASAEEATKQAQDCDKQIQDLQTQLDQQTLQSQSIEADQATLRAALARAEDALDQERATAQQLAAENESLKRDCASKEAALKAREEEVPPL